MSAPFDVEDAEVLIAGLDAGRLVSDTTLGGDSLVELSLPGPDIVFLSEPALAEYVGSPFRIEAVSSDAPSPIPLPPRRHPSRSGTGRSRPHASPIRLSAVRLGLVRRLIA